MDQRCNQKRSLSVSVPKLLGVFAFLALQAGSNLALADSSNATICRDLVGQDPDPTELTQLITAAPGAGTRRIAILIGNDYPGRPKPDGTFERSKYAVPKLANAGRDAASVARLLLTLQFKVACFLNVSAKSHDRIITAATRVGNDATNALTLYYFAGHGFADGTESFAVGDGAEADTLETLRTGSNRQSWLLSGLRSRRAPVIAIFDMCRAPLTFLDTEGNRQLGATPLDGYRRISKEPGILVHYSTSPNEYAADLPGQTNGLYARVFLDQTPNQPGVSAEQLLNDKIGKILADGLQIDGKVYKQFPNLVAFPDDWTKIQIFDASLGSMLDSVMSAMILLESMVENGAAAIAIACQTSVDIRDQWKAAPDPVGSHTTVSQLLDRIEKLHQRMKDKGSPCPDILATRAEAGPLVLPPLAHVATTPIILSNAGEFADSFDLAKVGTWLTTNAVPLFFNLTKTGSFTASDHAAVQLNSAFVPSSKVTITPSTSDVYFTPIDGRNAKLVDTKDQVVARFKQGTADIVDPDKINSTIKNLKGSKLSSKLVVLLLPQNKPQERNYLDRLRLKSVRIVSLLKQIVKAGISYDRILIPSTDQDSPISISTIQQDEILVKFVGGPTPSFETLSVDSMKPSFVPTGAKENLEGYEAMTRYIKG
jgi:hypothetical protein